MLASTHITEGHLVAYQGAYGVELVNLNPGPKPYDAPWTAQCEGCLGTGIAHACDMLIGPCSSCWGSGRVLFAFEPDSIAAPFVPPAIAQPWIAQHR